MPKKKKLYLYLGVPLLAIAGISALSSKVEIVEEVRYEEIACEHTEQESTDLEVGKTEIAQECKNGKKKIIENVTYRNGKEDKREVASTEIEEPATDEIKLVGTKQPTLEEQTTTPATQSAPAQPQSASQNIDYSNEKQYGYCKDGTATYGNPHARGRANSCYGHGGWVGN